jgi:hypothetical protein
MFIVNGSQNNNNNSNNNNNQAASSREQHCSNNKKFLLPPSLNLGTFFLNFSIKKCDYARHLTIKKMAHHYITRTNRGARRVLCVCVFRQKLSMTQK